MPITRFTACFRGFLACLAALLLGAVLPAAAEEGFPRKLLVEDGLETRALELTGEAERVFFVFTIYQVAHYAEAQAFGSVPEPADVISDGPAKAIALEFTRGIGRDRIRREFEKTLRRNADLDLLKRADTTIRDFVTAIDRDAEAGDRLVYYWLPGGRLVAEYNGERFFSVTDTPFAKLIWSIWFGEDPVCDSRKLLARLKSPAPGEPSGGAAQAPGEGREPLP